jgi:hypothetical protein
MSSRAILAQMRVAWGQRVDLTRPVREPVRCVEVLVASSSPEPSRRIDDERVTDTAAKDRRAVRAPEYRAGPRTLFGVLCHEPRDLADELREKTCTVGSRRQKSLRDRPAEPWLSGRGQNAGLQSLTRSSCSHGRLAALLTNFVRAGWLINAQRLVPQRAPIQGHERISKSTLAATPLRCDICMRLLLFRDGSNSTPNTYLRMARSSRRRSGGPNRMIGPVWGRRCQAGSGESTNL